MWNIDSQSAIGHFSIIEQTLQAATSWLFSIVIDWHGIYINTRKCRKKENVTEKCSWSDQEEM